MFADSGYFLFYPNCMGSRPLHNVASLQNLDLDSNCHIEIDGQISHTCYYGPLIIIRVKTTILKTFRKSASHTS